MRNKNARIGKSDERELLRIMTTNSESALRELLSDLLTPAELHEIIARWQIIKLLSRGKGQREIARELHVSLQTVSRGTKALANSSGGFRNALCRTSN